MAEPAQEYRSLMLRKAQLLAQEHGGISNIPRELQTKLGFDVIAGRKGSFSVSVRIPEGDLSSRIAELKAELPPITFQSAKPAPERIFGKYIPQVSLENPTMDDFWIMQGWYKEGKIGIKLTYAKWSGNEKVKIEAIRFLVEKVLKKDPRDITEDDFYSNRLRGVLPHYSDSPYAALVGAGYAYSPEESLRHAKEGVFQTGKIYPWEMQKTPEAFSYKTKENRVAATNWLVKKLQKDPGDITLEDFYSNRLAGLVAGYYKGSSYAAVLEAGYAYSIEESLRHAKEGVFQTGKIYPWEMQKTPEAFSYKTKENRVAAVRWLAWKIQKDPRDITLDDFNSNRLAGLMFGYYNNSPYAALTEAGYAFSIEEALHHAANGSFKTGRIYPWEMAMAPNLFYKPKENRVAAVRWLAWKLQKDPRDIAQEDFNSNRLAGLIAGYYNSSPHAALTEAGYQIHPWEMGKTPMGFYDSKENRVAATRWLATKLHKAPRDIKEDDFNSNRLRGILPHYNGSPYEALLEAGLVTPEDEKYMRSRTNAIHDEKGRFA